MPTVKATGLRIDWGRASKSLTQASEGLRQFGQACANISGTISFELNKADTKKIRDALFPPEPLTWLPASINQRLLRSYLNWKAK